VGYIILTIFNKIIYKVDFAENNEYENNECENNECENNECENILL